MSMTASLAVPTRSSLAKTTVAVGLAAAAATTATAAAVSAAGVSLEVGGAPIPLAGFAQMTLLGAIIGGVVVAVCNRRSASPRQRFYQVTAVLTALSCVPSVALPPSVATKIALVTTHLLAAAIVIPVLARRTNEI